jgi:GNAT superfamily N-acetyltransferase
VDVRGFEAQDTPAVLDLLLTAFGRWPGEIRAVEPSEFFRWKHFLCPFGASSMYVAESDGVIVGFEARLPWCFTAGVKLLTASRGTDLAVHPAHRGRGISIALRRAAVFPRDVAFTWSNPNRQSLPGSLRFGRTLVGKVPRFMRLAGRLPRSIQPRVGQERPASVDMPIDAPTAREVLVQGTPAQVREPHGRLTTARDLNYLRWRYAFDDYRAVRAQTARGGDGIAIFRARRYRRFWGFEVCELIVERPDPGATRSLLRQVRDAGPVDFVGCAFQSRSAAARQGFVQYPGRTALTITLLQDDIDPDPARLSSWALTGGDLELL